jgi:anti-sigma regulatory factor (Ser/Thr protein kinase)
MMETLLELTLTPKSDYIALARLAVSLIAHRLAFACDAVADIEVAVGEACADAIGYGKQALDEDAALWVRCAAGSGLFVITVEARGRACDAPRPRHQGPFPTDHALSQFVLNALMDTASYRCTAERGMSIRMAKALPSAFTAPPAPADAQDTPIPLAARDR